jgi:putative tryptophan/tyrosine transport system substrate-binding protein
VRHSVRSQSLDAGQSHYRTRGSWGDRLRRRMCVIAVLLVLGSRLLTGNAEAGERAGPFLVGALTDSWGPTPPVVGLRDGLQERGYQESVHFVIGVRFTQGDTAALLAAARELVQHGVDIIFAPLEGPAKAAQTATDRTPIVFSGVGDPVGSGLVQSFARPGGNITGVTDLHLELGPKRLEVFLETVPGLKQVLFPYDANDAHSVAAARVYRDAARHLKIELVEKAIQTQEEAQATLAQVRRDEVDGILAPQVLSLNIPGFVLEATAQRAIPTMFAGAFWAEQGGFASYGPDYYDSGRQAARLVDKILKGGNPAEIPVEVNPKIELAINLQVAKTLGLTIAPEVLYRADRLIR